MHPVLSLENVRQLTSTAQAPCLSLYQPTFRRYPEKQQDLVRYRNLVTALDRSLAKEHDAAARGALLEPLRRLEQNEEFWRGTWDGLAVFRSANEFRVGKLHATPPELAIAASSFHVKPLLRLLQSADRYQVLALSRERIALYEGNRYHLDAVPLAEGVPATLEEALGEQRTEQHLTVAAYGGTGVASVHGHGSRKEEQDVDRERFFRAVDRAITEKHSQPSGLPLLLAALPEHHTPFRRISNNSHLLAQGLETDPNALSAEELRDRAWSILEPAYRGRIRHAVDGFARAQTLGRGVAELGPAAEAAAQGRVDTLLIESGRTIPGVLDAETGAITPRPLDSPAVDDVLDDLAERVLAHRGEVLVLPAGDMPSKTGLAATLRY